MKRIIIIFSLSFYFISSLVILPFKNQRSLSSLNKETVEKEQILQYLIKIDIAANIKVGTPSQIVPMTLSIDDPYIYITSNSLNIGIYDKHKSSSYTEKSKAYGDQKIFYSGYYSQDIFIFDEQKKNNLENAPFILVTEMIYDTEYRKGIIGLEKTQYIRNETLIDQLKMKEIISNYYFFIRYTEEDQGILVLGALPHEYYPNEYCYNDFRQANGRDDFLNWSLMIDKIKYGNEEYKGMVFDLKYNFGLIQVNADLKNKYLDDFFKNRIEQKLCEENRIDKYFLYSCIDNDNEVHFNELKDFHFYSVGLENDFVFTYKDLFVTFNNRRYFLITYELNSMVYIFGKPFFKKYPIVLNPDNKQVGCYNKILDDKNNNGSNYRYLLIVICIFVLVIIFLVLFYYTFQQFSRKKRVNEIDDNYDYLSIEKKI